MPITRRDNGFRIRYLCADGHYIERDITPSNADDVRREFNHKYYGLGTLNDYEFRQLLDGVQVAVDVQSSLPVPRLSALRSAVRRLIDAVGEWLGGEQDQCCGK